MTAPPGRMISGRAGAPLCTAVSPSPHAPALPEEPVITVRTPARG